MIQGHRQKGIKTLATSSAYMGGCAQRQTCQRMGLRLFIMFHTQCPTIRLKMSEIQGYRTKNTKERGGNKLVVMQVIFYGLKTTTIATTTTKTWHEDVQWSRKGQEEQSEKEDLWRTAQYKIQTENRCTTLTVQSVVSTTGKEPCEKGQRVKLCWQTMENAMDVAFKSQKEMGREV